MTVRKFDIDMHEVANRKFKERAKVDEKDETIANLQLQLQAQTHRAALLQTRLTTVLDSMDALRNEHRQKLDYHIGGKQKLQTKLDRLLEYTGQVEAERDESKECLLAVFNKVESTNDLSGWPYPRMSLPEPLEPINRPKPLPNDNVTLSCNDTGYFAALISHLRTELEKERTSHARTHDQAEAEIITLKAQLARRDAELEACVIHTRAEHEALAVESRLPEPNSSKLVPSGPSAKQRISASSISPEEASKLLGLTGSRNRRLEVEVKELATRLEKARTESRSPPQSLEANPPDSTTSDEDLKQSLISADDKDGGDDDTVTVVNVLTTQREPKTPGSPDLRPVVPLDMPSPFAMTPRGPPSPLRSLTTLQPLQVSSTVESSQRPGLHGGKPRPHTRPGKHEPSSVHKLEEQVSRLAAEIDAFSAQRRDILMSMYNERTVKDVACQHLDDADPKETNDLEPARMTSLRAELEAIKTHAAQREQELLEKIHALETALEQHHTSAPSNLSPFLSNEIAAESSTQGAHLAIQTSWDEDISEKSMELATPLEPLISLGADEDIATNINTPPETEYPDPLLIPLPASPIRSDASLFPTSRAFTIHDRPPTPFSFDQTADSDSTPILQIDSISTPTSSERIMSLQEELDAARDEVASRDAMLVDLHQAINKMRIQMKDAGLNIF